LFQSAYEPPDKYIVQIWASETYCGRGVELPTVALFSLALAHISHGKSEELNLLPTVYTSLKHEAMSISRVCLYPSFSSSEDEADMLLRVRLSTI